MAIRDRSHFGGRNPTGGYSAPNGGRSFTKSYTNNNSYGGWYSGQSRQTRDDKAAFAKTFYMVDDRATLAKTVYMVDEIPTMTKHDSAMATATGCQALAK